MSITSFQDGKAAIRMQQILQEMNGLALPVYFSIHPRTAALLEKHHIHIAEFKNIQVIPPQSYFDNLGYMVHANRIITDSGGLQKEAWFLKKPCVTLRPETEWIETLENQWNVLVFDNLSEIKQALQVQPGAYNEGAYGDGHSALKMRDAILEYLS
jgi:UDP-N-acetylglucosamine 2-epimerase